MPASFKRRSLRAVLSLLLLIWTSTSARLSAQDRFLSTGGPYGGPVVRLLAGSDGEFLALASGFQLFRTTDNGASWRPVPTAASGQSAPTIQVVAFDSSGMLHAAGAGILQSSADMGARWSGRSPALSGPPDDNDIQSRRLEAESDGTLYHVVEYRSLGYSVLHRKRPGGPWQEVIFPEPGERRFRAMTIIGGNVLLVGGNGGIWRSATAGESWTFDRTGFSATDTVTSIAGDSRGRVWARTQPENILYVSDNAGTTWTPLDHTGLPSNTAFVDLAAGRDNHLFATSMTGGYFSADGGKRWRPVPASLTRPDGLTPPRVVTHPTSGAALLALGDLYNSLDNGGTWRLSNSGLAASITLSLVEGSNGVLFCGTAGRLFRSPDRGRSWQLTGEGLPGAGLVYVLAAGRNGLLLASIYREGIYRSLDNGITWSASNQGLPTNRITSITPTSGGSILIGTLSGIYRSIDQGASWKSSDAGIPGEHIEGIAEAPGGALYAAVNGAGVYASFDSGATWVDRSSGLADPRLTSIYATPSGMLLAGTERNGIFRSADSGRNWVAVSEGSGSRGSLIARGWTTDRNGVHYVGADGGALRSTDDGLTWRGGLFPLLLSNTRGQPASLAMLATSWGDLFAASLGGGVLQLHTDSLLAWEHVPSAPSTITSLWTFDLYLNGIQPVYMSNSDSLLRYGFPDDDSVKWYRLDPAPGNRPLGAFAYDPRSNDMVVATTSGIFRQDVFASVPGIWQRSDLGLPPGEVTALATNAATRSMFAGTSRGLYRSIDGGRIWALAGGSGASPVEAIEITSTGRIVVSHELGLFRSDDNGETWQSARTGLPFAKVTAMARHGSKGLLAGTAGSGLYRSIDNAATWQATPGALPNGNVTSVAVTAGGTIIAGTDAGAFQSTDGGRTWKTTIPFSGKINSVLVANDGRVWIATAEGGVYRSAAGGRVSSVRSRPRNHAIDHQLSVVPNVSSGRIIIRYVAFSPVRMVVHGTDGAEVAVLHGGENGRVEFDTGSLSPGMYFVVMSAPDTRLVVPFLVVR